MQTTTREKKNIRIGEFKALLGIKGNIKQIVKDKGGVIIKIEERNIFGNLNKELEQRYSQEELNQSLNINGEVERMLLIRKNIPLLDSVEITYKYEGE